MLLLGRPTRCALSKPVDIGFYRLAKPGTENWGHHYPDYVLFFDVMSELDVNEGIESVM